MKLTQLTYLENTYLFEGTATIITVSNNEFGEYIILDSTIFYPQGGGQPTDTGKIVFKDNTFTVHMVKIDEKGTVYHYGTFNNSESIDSFTGKDVSLQINSANRIINAQNHTAGHLIDIAVKNAGLNLSATKGYHFQNGCYVEYTGTIDDIENNREKIISQLNSQLEQLISDDIKIITQQKNTDINSPLSPTGKSYRTVFFEGYEIDGCGCGGTHILSTGEFKRITVKKIRIKKGIIKISYTVE